MLLGFDLLAALYVALAVTASSTLMVVTLLRQWQQFFEPFGRLVIGVLLLQDVLVVLLLPVLTHATDGPAAIALGVSGTLGLLTLTGLWVRWIGPFLLLKLKLDEEGKLLTVLATLFGFAGLAYAMELPVVTGAFLAGVAMSGFPVTGVVRGQVTSLGDFFLAVFFVALGASVSFPDLPQLLLEGILLLGVLLLTPPIVVLMARRAGLTVRSAIRVAHLLAQCGELGIMVVLVGVERGHVDEDILAVIVLVAVVTMAVTPLIATDTVVWRLMHWHPGQRRIAPPQDLNGHVLILGCGRHMRPVLRRLVSSGQRIVVVDHDAAVVEELKKRHITAIRGDGADEDVLCAAGAGDARVVVSSMGRLRDNKRLAHFVQGRPVLVRVFAPDEGERLRAVGATPIVESEAAADAFIRWFERWDRERASASGRV